MKKIPTLFKRDPEDMRHVTAEVHPGCQWVLDGEGVATRKYDGTCTMLDEDGNWWARREVKPDKTPPANWVEVDHDTVTGKRTGWEPIEQSAFAKFHAEALDHWDTLAARQPGTYELCGPKINRNPEGYAQHVLVAHSHAAKVVLPDVPLSYDTLRPLLLGLAENGVEGIVWHHPDGRMAKLKGRDFRREECRIPPVATEEADHA